MKWIRQDGPLRPEAFFEILYAKFQEVAPNPSPYFIGINNKKIKLLFANDLFLKHFTPALEHLRMDDCETELTICLWDSHSTGSTMPAPPWTHDDYLPRGGIRGWENERFSISFQLGSSILSFYDKERNIALFWTSDLRTIPYWERGAPLLAILQWWGEQQGGSIIHAGAVGTKEGGVLLVGKGGSGKSTTALSSLNSSLFYAADDYCFVSKEVWSLYTSAKVDWKTLKKLPHLNPPPETNEEKALLFLYPTWKERLVAHFPLRAIFIPRIAQETKLIPCSAAEALIALAPSTMFQLPRASKRAFETMANLTRSIPAYYLNLGPNIPEVSETIAEFVNDQCHYSGV